MISGFIRTLMTIAVLAACGGAMAQAPAPPFGAQQPSNPACVRLESQLAALDRGAADPVRAEQIKRYEDAASKQQVELDRTEAQARRLGCERSTFFLFGGGTGPQCDQINDQITRMRTNLDKMLADLQRLQGNTGDRESQRRSILIGLADNNCGPQYRNVQQTRPGGFLDTIFGNLSNVMPDGQATASTYRTVCVRTCDGFYFPISFATVPTKFQEDARACQRMCPAGEVQLYSYPNPGGDMQQAVSVTGQPYSALPTAFRYRQQFDPACTCKPVGQTWAEVYKNADTVERGDIVVTPERAKALSQPKPDTPPLRGSQDPRKSKTAVPAEPVAETRTATPETPAPAPKKEIRSVGPTFYPVR